VKYLEASADRDRNLAEERLIFGATELVCQALEDRGVNRKQLAERLGVSAGEITQRLNGNRNLTLRTVADMFDALAYDVQLKLTDRCVRWSRVPGMTAVTEARQSPWDGTTRYTRTGESMRLVKADVA
jgi:transcriptional regulator with XRE-family HTH domain